MTKKVMFIYLFLLILKLFLFAVNIFFKKNDKHVITYGANCLFDKSHLFYLIHNLVNNLTYILHRKQSPLGLAAGDTFIHKTPRH